MSEWMIGYKSDQFNHFHLKKPTLFFLILLLS